MSTIEMDFENAVAHAGNYPSNMTCQNGMAVDYSPPVEFGGLKGPLTPEDAFVGSANMCFQIVFRTVSSGLGLSLMEYRCRAVGDLQTVDGKRRFVKITLHPEMSFAEGSKMENLEKAIVATKSRCLVTNSMTCEVVVEPKVL